MARIEDLLTKIDDAALRTDLEREVAALKEHVDFGLVFERHIPETVDLLYVKPLVGDLVRLRREDGDALYRVFELSGRSATLTPLDSGESIEAASDDLLVVKPFGEPVYPALTPLESVVRSEEIDIDEVMGSFIKPLELTERPALVALGIEWPTEFWLSTSEELQVAANGQASPLLDAELCVTDFSRSGPFRFEVRTPEWTAPYEAHVERGQLVFRAAGADVVVQRARAAPVSLSAYFEASGPLILLEEEAMIVPPAILLKPDSSLPPFDPAKLEVLDWSGTDLRKESQGKERDPASIQARAIEHVVALEDWDVVLDDDGTGEVADIVAIRMDGSDLRVLLVHCKYSSQDFSGSRVEDLYDVCGQTQKSIRWRHYVDDMLARLIKREQRRVQRDQYSGFHVGDGNDLYRLRDEAYRLRPAFTIAIAQPGVSKRVVSQEQLHLLAGTEVYLSEVAVADFAVWCNA